MSKKTNMVALLVIALFVSWSIGGPTRADDHYYMLIFGVQGQPNRPRFSHTFATFVKAAHADEFPKGAKLEVHTISWMPATLEVAPLRRRPETGKNLDLAASIDWARSVNAQITMWGPFAIKKELFDKAKAQEQLLEGGKIGYIALDGGHRGNGASNCVHAVSDIVPEPMLNTGTAHGNAASQMVLRHLSGFIEKEQGDYSWLIERLGLKDAKIHVADSRLR